MPLLDLILLAFLAYRNGSKARTKGLNGWLWGTATVLSFFAALFIGVIIVVFNFCADKINVDLLSSTDPVVRLRASQQVAEVLGNDPLQVFTIEFFGIGGYLLVRYLLERRPGKKTPEVHWMDKLENNNS